MEHNRSIIRPQSGDLLIRRVNRQITTGQYVRKLDERVAARRQQEQDAKRTDDKS